MSENHCKHKWKKMDFDYRLCINCGYCQTNDSIGIFPWWHTTTFTSMMNVIEARKSRIIREKEDQKLSREKALQYLSGDK